LNHQPLLKGTPELLALGDRIDLASVIGLTVSDLGTDGRDVHAVWIDRGDALAGRLRYLLTDGRGPVAVRFAAAEQPALWLAWRCGKDPGPRLVAWRPGATWLGIPVDQEVAVGPLRLRWRLLETPNEQDQYFFDRPRTRP
jgi:hypothetical protein